MTAHELIRRWFDHSGRIAGSYRLEIEAASASHEVPCGRLRIWISNNEDGSRRWTVVTKEELALLLRGERE